jgi:hypothetical protein
MKNSLFWIAAGGLSFWLPAILAGAVLHQNASAVLMNVVSLAGLIFLGAASWICAKKVPKWGWVLAGIYILGPVSMLAPLAFAHASPAPVNSGGTWILILLCLFPPTTLWFSLLNFMIFSVLIATVTLPFLAVYLRGPGLRPGSPLTQ